MGISLSTSTLTDEELRYLDQVGSLPITAEWGDLISAVEGHALSLPEAHQRIFLKHLKRVNPTFEARIQGSLKKDAIEVNNRIIARINQERQHRYDAEREFLKTHGKDWTLAKVREIHPGLCGLRCAHRVYIRKVTTQESIDITLSLLMRNDTFYSVALPCLLGILKDMHSTWTFDISDHETFHLCATTKDRNKVIASLRAHAKKTMKGYELVVPKPNRGKKRS